MRTQFKTLLYLVGIYLLGMPAILVHASTSQDVLVLDNQTKEGLALGRYLTLLRDEKGHLTYQDVNQADIAQLFTSVVFRSVNLGFDNRTYWYRLVIRNQTTPPVEKERWVLSIPFPPLDTVDVYVATGDGELSVTRAGDQRPPLSDALTHRDYAVPLKLPPGETATIHMRVQIDGSHQLPLYLWSETAYDRKISDENVLFGMFYGVMLVMLLYNLIIYLVVRDRAYLYYIGFIFFLTSLLLTTDGLLFAISWWIYPGLINGSIGVLIGASSLFCLLFIRTALQTARHVPLMDYIMRFIQYAAVVGMLLPFFTSVKVSSSINLQISGLMSIMVAATIIVMAIRRHRIARLFLIAWSMLLVGILAQALVSNNLLPSNLMTEYAVHIGACVLVAMLSIALADRINTERVNRESLERERMAAESHAKREFLAKMSHELRTPMNAIVGFTDLALRSDTREGRMEYLGNIRAASLSMQHIIDDVLDLTRLEEGKLKLDIAPFNLRALLEKCVNRIGPAATLKKIAVVLSCDPELPDVLIADAARLEQVLNSLLDNAVKFTEAGEVTLFASQLSRDANQVNVIFRVTDTGIGISEEQLTSLFKPFAQADQSMSRKYGGSGLGLVICKELVELMGSKITTHSTVGEGSEFRFLLKLPIADAVETETSSPEETKQRDPAMSNEDVLDDAHILLVDDNALNRRLASEILRETGVILDMAENGREAVEAVEVSQFDAVLMDLQMPEMDGFEATRRIRRMPHGEALPIIAMTANTMDQDRQDCLAAGMNDFLPKPVNADDLISTLCKWVQANQAAPMTQLPAAKPEPTPEIISEPEGLPDALPGIDLAGALQRLGGRDSLLLEVLQEFTTDQAEVARNISSHIEAGQTDEAVRAAHSLKGLAASVGCNDLAELAKGIENRLKNNHLEGIGEDIDRLQAELDKVSQSIARLPTSL